MPQPRNCRRKPGERRWLALSIAAWRWMASIDALGRCSSALCFLPLSLRGRGDLMPKALGGRLKFGLKHDTTPFLIALFVFVLSCRPPAPPERLIGRGVVQKIVLADRRV